MPIEVGIWRIDGGLVRLPSAALDKEAKLEEALVHDITMLGPDIVLIGRQVKTADGKLIDLLAIDVDGNLHVIELKRDKTPRDAVAQLLDYGSWVQGLSHDDVIDIYQQFSHGGAFEQSFEKQFGVPPPESLNEAHRLVLVASELDSSSERIVEYTARFGVPINAVFFRYFRDGEREYIARTWLIEPTVAEALKKGSSSKEEPWNGTDFGVTLGEGPHRHWEGCRRYRFVSGGQGVWYSRTLKQLTPGSRVFTMIPSRGYVGVGTVKDEAVPVSQFMVQVGGSEVPLIDAPDLHAPMIGENADDPEKSEYAVRVEWIKTRAHGRSLLGAGHASQPEHSFSAAQQVHAG